MSGRQHGTRAKYTQDKCRCDECRAANTDYQRQRTRRVAPTLVDASRARKHIIELRASGVGRRQIAAESGVSVSMISKIVKGSERIRPRTEAAILGLTQRNVANRAYVDAGPTWDIIAKLLEAGWTKGGIDAALGGRGRALQLRKDRITHAKAKAIAELWERVANEKVPVGPVVPRLREAYQLPRPWEGDVTWMDRGSCRRDGAPTWLFFAHAKDERTVNAAKDVCATCPVSGECLAYALRNRCVGVWGGTLDAERKDMVKPCVDCGVDLEGRHAVTLRCEPCQEAYRLRYRYAWREDVGKHREAVGA